MYGASKLGLLVHALTLTMLSEKAKGKQRATEPLADATASSSSPTPSELTRTLVVRFTEGTPDLILTVNNSDTVLDVKKNVCCPAVFNS